MKGFVSELAWSDPSTVPAFSLIACLGSRVYHVRFPSEAAAGAAFHEWADSLVSHADLLLELPLVNGKVFGQEESRDDAMYGWVPAVLEGQYRPPDGCPRPTGVGHELAYRTLPDHQLIHWRPGLGISRYLYGHHGTAAGVEVQLIRCRRGAV
jgi:hypothetical protein